MDGRPVARGPGKSAPRLLNDLLDHDPRYYGRNGRNLLADPAPIYRGVALLRKGPNDCRHQLIKKVNQTEAPNSNDEIPTKETKYKVATYCAVCQYHFEIIVDFTQGIGATSCRLKDAKNPMHHLRLIYSWIQKRDGNSPNYSKYNPIIESHRFICSGSSCPAVVEINISLPRLPPSMLPTILDATLLKARGVRIIAGEPERYLGQSPLLPLQVFLNLRAYLNDAKAGSNGLELKKIARRNKKFCLAFADECDDLFHYLDFKPVTEVSEGVEPSEFWQLPIITDDNSEFIDEVLAEIDLLIASRPPAEQRILNNRVTHKPLPANQDITRSLGCFQYPTRSRHVDLTIEPHPYYASLGAQDNFTDELLLWAYDRQCECDPRNKPYYLDCLAGLAEGRNSGDLQTKQAMAESEGGLRLSQIEKAYRFFTLDPNREHNEETIIGTYKSRIESAPLQREEARRCLDIIGRAKDNEKIRFVANDKTMTLKEAFEFLELPEDVEDDMIQAMAVGLVQDKDKTRVAAAVRTIAKHRGGGLFLYDVANDADPEYVMENQEAYFTLQIDNRALSDDLVFEYFKQATINATPIVHERSSRALYSIATLRRSELLFAKMSNPDAVIYTPNEPVGLDNIGNTCYLNSLLQFYYTIGSVREVVMNIDKYRMDLNSPSINEDIMKKQVGGRKIKRFEVSKAQKFVEELHKLFEALRTAPTKSVRPTNQLAELTLFSDAAEADYRKKSISSPNGPPNLGILHADGPVFGPEGPPIPQPSTSPVDDDIEMVDRPSDKNMGNGSDTSESTLVDMDALPSYGDAAGKEGNLISFDEKKTVDADVIDLEDAVMVNRDDLSPGTEKTPLDLEKPVLPPRNNKNLSIQTNNNKPDNDMLTFGAQQDVTEVIGNVVWRLSCAIKPTSIDPVTGEQMDMIRDTFYGANAVYTEKANNPERKVESWAQLIVFPHASKPRDIYEALDVVFDEQTVFVENDNTPQYASITKLPPILQIHIQRTDFDPVKKVSFKNRNPVSLPETIYMDRYMDSDDPNLLRRRREAWKWKAQLRALETRKTALEETEVKVTVPDALLATKKFITELQAVEIDGLDIDSDLPDALDERKDEVAHELNELSTEITALKRKISEQFMDLTKYEYKLQTIFIHRGESSGGGHYWIYLYDFETSTWREYNDENVDIRDRNRVFGSDQTATPYYLAYVRSTDKEHLVNAVVRDVKEVGREMMDVSQGWNGQQDEGGIAMVDEESGESRHVENPMKAPRPILPRPAAASWENNQWATNGQPSELDANGRKW